MTQTSAIPECFLQSRQFYYTQIGMDGNYSIANPFFLETFGFSEKEISQKQAIETIHPEDRDICKQVSEKCLQQPGKPFTITLRKPAVHRGFSHTRWEFTYVSETETEEACIQCIGYDVTDEMLARESVNEFHKKVSTDAAAIETILSNNIDVILLADRNGVISFCSPNIQKEMGYTPDELIGKSGFEFVHPEDLEIASKAFGDEVNHPDENNSVDLRFKRKDGSWMWAETKGRNLLSNPLVNGMIVNLNNISIRKQTEEDLIFKERIKQNQIAQAAVNAQEKERADIGKELHDNISQMLTSTKLFLDILKNKTPDELLDRSLKNINTIITEVRNISRSLVPSGIEDLGLIASLSDLIDNIRVTNIIDLEFYPDTEVETLINSNYKLTLYRIVQEQINNIVKHSSARSVLIELFAEDNHIHLIVTDDGQGFNLGTVKKGQGLKNMQSRAELLNGTTEIITSPGKGCKLKVTIPY